METTPEQNFLYKVLEEHERMVAAGFTANHDDEQTDGSLIMGAFAYAMDGGKNDVPDFATSIWSFPFDPFAPNGHHHNIIRASALLMAEGLRVERLEKEKNQS